MAGFSNPVKSRALEGCSNISFPLVICRDHSTILESMYNDITTFNRKEQGNGSFVAKSQKKRQKNFFCLPKSQHCEKKPN